MTEEFKKEIEAIKAEHRQLHHDNFAGAPLDYPPTKRDPKEILIEYAKMKLDEGDWHAVSDVANDLRVLEAKSGR